MKYIDAEKIRSEVERIKETGCESPISVCNDILSFIDSLQQEQDCIVINKKDWEAQEQFRKDKDFGKPLPFLSANFEDAAEKYANKEFPDEPSCGQWGTGDYEPPVDMEYPREVAKDSFKAGAEWLAGQGVCIPAHIFMPCEIKDVYDSSKGEYPAAIHPDCGGSLVLERYLKDFKHNEEVILQIRKKDE